MRQMSLSWHLDANMRFAMTCSSPGSLLCYTLFVMFYHDGYHHLIYNIINVTCGFVCQNLYYHTWKGGTSTNSNLI